MTLSYVVPYVLSLNRHLEEMKKTVKYCLPLVNALMTSLRTRFSGVFERTGMMSKLKPNCEFSDDVYFISTVLDPMFTFQWIDCDVIAPDLAKDTLRCELQGMRTEE